MRISDWSSYVCSSDLLLVTVLSRCLQFNLKRLDEEQIGGQISKILEAEGIAAKPGAVHQLASAADGSLRDGLSLLDQAIGSAERRVGKECVSPCRSLWPPYTYKQHNNHKISYH